MFEYQNIFETFSSTEYGLDSNEATYRIKKYGLNQLTEKAQKPLILRFAKEFIDPMILLLLAATLIAFFNGDQTDAYIILIVIILNGAIGFFQKYKAEKAIEALKKIISPQSRVLRNRQQMSINTNELVPGDIIIVNEGDTIPADAIVFQTNEFETSEAILSGESYPIQKSAFNIFEKGSTTNIANFVFMSTTVARGNARALVIKTGMETEFGKIANLTQATTKDKTPLEKEIHKIGLFAAQITLLIVAIIFAFEYIVHHRALIDNLIFASSIAVAAVPEGLPAVITIALALGVQRLSHKKAIIRQLSSVETLGATTVICTDKTGTLTKNEMTVTQALVDDFYFDIEGVGYEPRGKYKLFSHDKPSIELSQDKITPEFIKKNYAIATPLKWFGLCALLCNNSSLVQKNNYYSILGDPTEGALLVMAKKIDFYSTDNNIAENFQEIHELPFDSNRKVMTKIFLDKKQGKYYAFTKGAPDQLIQLCDQRLHHGKTVILTKGLKEDLIQINNQYGEEGLRTIALAYREIPSQHLEQALSLKNFEEKIREIEKKFTFLGIAGISDPPREEVKEAISLTKIAGIKTYIITGDHGLTAASVAKQIGLISDSNPYEILTGDQLDQLSDQTLAEKFSNKQLDIIFARTKPEHKLRLVSLLKQNKEIVAVTGDGVNDAPALQRADIGVAMGINGSDVSKQAANMILLDDSYSTIVTAIKEGRTIYANLKKFIYYIFSSNVGEVFTIFFSLILGLQAPLTAILLLTINFFTDLLPALALGIEPAEKNIMQIPPRDPASKIINKQFTRRIILVGLAIGITMVALYLYKLYANGWSFGQIIPDNLLNQASSLIFIALVFIQIANSFNSKTENQSLFSTSFFNNTKLIWANLLSAILAIAVVEIPVFQNLFKTSSLNLLDWGLVALSCILITIFIEIDKYFTRHHQSTHHSKHVTKDQDPSTKNADHTNQSESNPQEQK